MTTTTRTPRTPLHPLRLAHRGRRLLVRRAGQRCQRGDIPGWVLITVMTVSIGTALWGLAKPQLVSALENALRAVQ